MSAYSVFIVVCLFCILYFICILSSYCCLLGVLNLMMMMIRQHQLWNDEYLRIATVTASADALP